MLILAAIALITVFTLFTSGTSTDIFCHDIPQPHKWTYDKDDKMICAKCRMRPNYEGRDNNASL